MKNGFALISAVFTILIITILVMSGFLGKTYLQLRNLETIQNPDQFTKDFDPISKNQTYLEVGGLEGRTIKSPFFPYLKLKTKEVVQGKAQFVTENGKETNLSSEGRYLNTDPFWNIFWIEIGRYPEQSKFFGPYKSVR